MGPGPVWTGAENLVPTGIRSPDRPARSESLYRLSYPGPGSVLISDNKWQYDGLKMLLRIVAIQYFG